MGRGTLDAVFEIPSAAPAPGRFYAGRFFAYPGWLRRARHLLENTTLAVQEVADYTGFGSAFYFATRFKRFTGESPTGYRDRHRRSRGEQ